MTSVPFHIVGIGCSEGGLTALPDFFRALPEKPGAAFVVLPHLQRHNKSPFDAVLHQYTSMPVVRVIKNTKVELNTIYLLTEGTMLTIHKDVLQVRDREHRERIVKTVDTFFASLAREYRNKAIGVVLSGNGSDGTNGARLLHTYGGKVLAQWPLSAPERSMPAAVIEGDSPDYIATPAKLAQDVMKLLSE